MSLGPISACQICGSRDLRSALFLGFLPPVNSMRPLGTPADEEPWYPAELLVCPTCHLAQLGFAVDPAMLFPPGYPYTSGSTRILRDNFAELYREVTSRSASTPDDLVVDIGSNDGTLLANFHERRPPRARHRADRHAATGAASAASRRSGVLRTRDVAEQVVAEHGRPRLVTADERLRPHRRRPRGRRRRRLLVGDDGVFITESHYLGDLIETLQYDTIYHEHLRYYSLTSLQTCSKRHGFGSSTPSGSRRTAARSASTRRKATATPVDDSVDAPARRGGRAA